MRCKPEEEIISYDISGELEFDRDTVLFDTIFTGIGSTTRRLKVFNPSANAVNISKIELGGGTNSSYQIIINGTEQNMAEELVLFGKDSILILVEVFIDPKDENNPYLVNDSIIFETNGKQQSVKLVAWGQDANYLGNTVLPCDFTWTKDRPYVLYASVLVDTLCSLNIEKGTKIFAAKDAYLYVSGHLISKGDAKERIVFRNDRLEIPYENIPGQWGGIIFLPGSRNNIIEFTTIRNAIYGIRLGTPDQDTIPDVVLKNVMIENMSHSGIINFTSDLYAENTLVNNCIEFICANIAGGNYTYKHCTFANYGLNFIRQSPSFYVSDNIELDDGSSIIEDISVSLQNSIIHGDLEDELFFNLGGGADYQLALSSNLIRSTIPELDTLENILNMDPKFIDPFQYDYHLDTLSPAKNAGRNLGIKTDLDGNDRDESPDIGAYERIE
jgi:hypothetical protein